MDIAFGFDEHYSGYVQVTIESILQQHPDDRDITFWVMTTKEGRDLLREPLRRQTIGRAHVEMLDSGESFRGLPLPGRWKLPWISAAMYLRLLMPAAVSRWTERLLYLDVDVLCMSSLTELWETNLGGASLGAVVDTCTPTIGSRTGLPGAPDFIKPDNPYFNSGILVIDVQEWLRSQITERCFDYLSGLRGVFRFPDQDALNVAAHRRWLELDNKWNYLVNFDPDPQPDREHTGIVHFAGQRKPWQEDYPHTALRSRYVSLMDRCRQDPREQVGGPVSRSGDYVGSAPDRRQPAGPPQPHRTRTRWE
jgi:lipopolysaccharide biosynthesis glycosyltransferase